MRDIVVLLLIAEREAHSSRLPGIGTPNLLAEAA